MSCGIVIAFINSFFAEEAFLCQKDYLQAMLICLEAVEQNKPAILAEVNPNLVSVSNF